MARSHFSRGSSRSSFSSSRSSSFSRSSSRSHTSSSYSRGHSHSRSSYGGPIHHHTSHHHHTGIYIHGGVTRLNPIKALTTLTIFVIILASAAFYFISQSLETSKERLSVIEADYNYYQDMIRNAENNPEYQVEAKITAICYDMEYGLYFIEYEVEKDNSYGTIVHHRQESFAMYTLEESYNLNPGDIIKIAVITNGENILESINMDYKNVALEEDIVYAREYEHYKSQKLLTFVIPIFAIILVTLFISIIVKKKKNKENSDNDSNTDTTTTTINTTTATPPAKKCEYCGHIIPAESNQCPGCGATYNK